MTGICVTNRSMVCSRFTPITPLRAPVMPTSLTKAVPLRQDPSVGSRHMGVRAEHSKHAPIQIPSHRNLLARCLCVEVDDDRIGFVA